MHSNILFCFYEMLIEKPVPTCTRMPLSWIAMPTLARGVLPCWWHTSTPRATGMGILGHNIVAMFSLYDGIIFLLEKVLEFSCIANSEWTSVKTIHVFLLQWSAEHFYIIPIVDMLSAICLELHVFPVISFTICYIGSRAA